MIGTPAEEICNAGGKILLLERGAFAGTHFAMMAHPAPVDMAAPPFIAVCQFEVKYTGKEAHASAFPELGINAADALVVAQTSIGLLRQHIHPTDRIHGIVTHGGEAPNIVPAHTSARYMVRARTVGELHEIRSRVHRCFEAGAIATGAKLKIEGGDKPYAELVSDRELAAHLPAQWRDARPPLHRAGCGDEPRRRLDRHGQRLAGLSDDPSDHRNQLVAGGESSARIHRVLHHAGRRPGDLRRLGRDGVDGDRRGVGRQAARAPDERSAPIVNSEATAASPTQARASSTRLNGVAVARRTRENPPLDITSRNLASPA